MVVLNVRRRGVAFELGMRAFPVDRMSSSIRGTFRGAKREIEVELERLCMVWGRIVDG